MPDLRALGVEKDFRIRFATDVDRLGNYEDLLTSPEEVKEQVDYNTSHTQPIPSDSPEVNDDNGGEFVGNLGVITREVNPIHIPKLKFIKPDLAKSYEENLAHLFNFLQHETARISRKPNRWDTNCNLVLNPSDPPMPLWTPRLYMATVSITNQSISAGSIYVSSSQEKLVSSVIRGKSIAPGVTLNLDIEAGGWVVAPSGATVDVIIAWHETEETT